MSRLTTIIRFLGIASILRMSKRQLFKQMLESLHSAVASYMQWKIYSFLFNNDSPLVVVLTESMLPGFTPGDILMLYRNNDDNYEVGDMTVFQFFEEKIPIVHRAINKHGNMMLTKGDNNRSDDVYFYEFGQKMLYPNNIKSKVVAYTPFLGKLSIYLNKYPIMKVIMIGFSVVYTFVGRSN
ncbi:Signal peptidase complex catalytic subunit SEC11 [Cucumispora dikerogammari]|nr:Signal peptidase complex catalytic subunit SEC11 [Cucumispora dikerogammari]